MTPLKSDCKQYQEVDQYKHAYIDTRCVYRGCYFRMINIKRDLALLLRLWII